MQLFNPFRFLIKLITAPFKIAVFLGHLLSMGMMGDKLDNVHPIATTLLSTSNEAIQDVHYFLPEQEEGHPNKKRIHPENQTANQREAAPQEPHKPHAHNHSHADLSGKFLKFILFPIYLLSALWDYSFSQLNQSNRQQQSQPQQENSQHNDRHSSKRRLTFAEARQKSFSGHHHHAPAPQPPKLSSDWNNYEKEKEVTKLVQQEAAKLPEKGKEAIEALKARVLKPHPLDNAEILLQLLDKQQDLQTQTLYKKIVELASEFTEKKAPLVTPTPTTPAPVSPGETPDTSHSHSHGDQDDNKRFSQPQMPDQTPAKTGELLQPAIFKKERSAQKAPMHVYFRPTENLEVPKSTSYVRRQLIDSTRSGSVDISLAALPNPAAVPANTAGY